MEKVIEYFVISKKQMLLWVAKYLISTYIYSEVIKKVNLKVQGKKWKQKIKIRSLSFFAKVRNDVKNSKWERQQKKY